MGSKLIPMFLEINTFRTFDSAEPTSDDMPVLYLAGFEYIFGMIGNKLSPNFWFCSCDEAASNVDAVRGS